jgi:hypothetical protein
LTSTLAFFGPIVISSPVAGFRPLRAFCAGRAARASQPAARAVVAQGLTAAAGRPGDDQAAAEREVYNAEGMARTESPLMTAGASVRLAYGIGAMFAPRFIAGRYAAAEPDSVMNLRGFGGQHIAVAVFTLFAARSRQMARSALLLNAGIEVCDMVAGGLEVRERGTSDPIAVGGVLLPLVGLTTWLTALNKLDR